MSDTQHEIAVTDHDIAAGEIRSCSAHPVAFAIKRLVPGAHMVLVGANNVSILWDTEDFYQVYPLPDFVARHILNFDLEKGMDTFTFTLDTTQNIPEPVVR